MKKLILACLFLILLGGRTAYAQTVWSEGTWFPDATGGYPTIAQIPWTALTHVDMVGGAPQSGGSITLSSGLTTYAAALITAAHAHSVKVNYDLTNLGSGTDFNGAMSGTCSSGTLQTFIANIMSTVNSYGFDGVFVDYEETYSSTFPTFMACLRTAMGTKLIEWYAGTNYQIGQWGSGNVPTCTGSVWPDGVALTVSASVDRVIMSGYDFNNPGDGAVSYFGSPLYSDVGQANWSDDYAAQVAAACGIAASKVSISIPFFGSLFSINTAPYQTWNGSSAETDIYYNTLAADYSLGSATFDSTAKNPWLAVSATGGNPAGYITFENATSITDKINYVYANSLGGWMLWTMGLDYTSGSMPLLSAVAAAMTPTASTPTFSPVAGVITSGTTIAISTATSGCSAYIYWSFSHNPPTTGDTKSTTSSAITSPSTLYAKVIGCPGYSDSAVGSAAYTISSAPPAPAPPGGLNIIIGTVNTLPAGSSATVNTTGSTSSQTVLNFGLPKGPTGAIGPTGLTGKTGATGPAGQTPTAMNCTCTEASKNSLKYTCVCSVTSP